jgi:hypothetical protein
MTLAGYDLKPDSIRSGERLNLSLYWKANGSTAVDYSIFVHVVDADGQIRYQQDGPPVSGNAPTSWWRPGDLLRDDRELSIPDDLPSGSYLLELGVYDSASGTRLPLYDEKGTRQPDDQWQIPIRITKP